LGEGGFQAIPDILFFVAGCDDDRDERKDSHKVKIYISRKYSKGSLTIFPSFFNSELLTTNP